MKEFFQLKRNKIIIIVVMALAIFLGYYFTISAGLPIENEMVVKVYWIIAFFITIGFVIASSISLLNDKMKLEYIFFVVYLVVASMYCAFLPPTSAPDDPAHMFTVYSYTNPADVEDLYDSNGRVIVRETDLKVYDAPNHFPSEQTYMLVFDEILNGYDNGEIQSYNYGSLPVLPIGYIPQILGALIAELLGTNGMLSMYLMKAFAMIIFGVCIFFAIRITPKGKYVFFSVAMLPMTLQMVTSFNYDASIMAASLLLTAYFLKLILKKEKISFIDYIPIFIMGILLTTKVVYVVLLFMGFLISKSKFKKNHFYWIYNTLSIVVVGVGVALIFVLRALNRNNMPQDIESTGMYTISDIFSDVGHSIIVFGNSIYKNFDMIYSTMIGSKLGWLEIPINNIIVIAFSTILLISIFVKSEKQYIVSNKMKIMFLVIFVCSFLAICAALWIDSTSIESTYIQGIQGRYFIPIVPVVLLVFDTKKIQVDKSIERWIPVLLMFFNSFAIKEFFAYIVSR